ncbi:DsbA family protein [Rhodovarius crocodyli]|uniref:DsbA family protein n=1 Tax=Rhodovarius crocodyli TaxID=1979269 RepID=A0A437MHA9_9PROT|nr:DsbA family protein [Rhodovarius crocodyli]RVT97034.1 DsbA family protein [Rhodovarius crocodyli]
MPFSRRLALGALLAAPAHAALAQALTEAQRAEVLDLLRRALREDPSILREALAAVEAADQREQAEAATRALTANADALFRNPDDPVKGNPQGRITLVEFFDARCGYCKAMHPTMEEAIRRNGQLRVVLKDIPILGPNSVLASRALFAAQRQNRYTQLYDALMRGRDDTTEAVLRREAERLGMDWTRLRRDMDDPSVARRIETNLNLARALNIQGTPAMVVGSTIIPGAVGLQQLEAAIAAAA